MLRERQNSSVTHRLAAIAACLALFLGQTDDAFCRIRPKAVHRSRASRGTWSPDRRSSPDGPQYQTTGDSVGPPFERSERMEPFHVIESGLNVRAHGSKARPRASKIPSTVLVVFTPEFLPALREIIFALKTETNVKVIAAPEAAFDAEAWLESESLVDPRVDLWVTPIDSPWVRDFGPIEFVNDRGQVVWLDSDYGSNRPHDDAFPRALGDTLGQKIVPLNYHLDGGALERNGHGLCVTTHEFLDKNGLFPRDHARLRTFARAIGCAVLVSVPSLANDPTHHADMFLQFVGPERAILAEVAEEDSETDHARMDEAARGIEEGAARLGQRLNITRVPLPLVGPGAYRTYVNGLRTRTQFLVPKYNDVSRAKETSAYRALSVAMPGTKLVPIDSDPMIARAGSVHCVSLDVTWGQHSLSSAVRLRNTRRRFVRQ